MQIVHYGHACVLVDTGSARLLFDPGTFSHGFEELRDLDAILITHQHFDHLDQDRLPALVAANPTAALIVDPGSVEDVSKLGLDAEQVGPGDALTLAGASVNVTGGKHAIIYDDLPKAPNVAYVVDHGAFFHPGDSLFVPEQKIDVLALPTQAPWLRTGEAIDYLRAVSPRVAVPIHQALLTKEAMRMSYSWFERMAPDGCELRPLTPGEPAEV
ncbi:MBL fold metallo-hydrolase [Actinophytocola gossypii]|uniref:MBL fold metallo-hydrolase n=1 Tax=Actinophytocola gossypii TaxID=2812003 RepID=A0ABT2JEW8_9PSEU|nr:MBL fold metallo-hydrolase [Actinophytocola gossypii]MCT2585985.1 MBL fold metallo-hydrolase [Actinophytocola gossypii]